MHAPTDLTSCARCAALAALVMIFSTPPWAHAATAQAAAAPALQIQQGFATLVKAVKPAVVTVSITMHTGAVQGNPWRGNQNPQLEEFFRRFFDGLPPRSSPEQPSATAVGSGFIIDAEGLVVTNHHVIENADEIEVVLDDGTRLPASLRGRDPKTDLALLKITAAQPLPYVQFGDSDAAQVGDWVVAIGNPFGLGGTATSGIISARGRDIHAGPLDDFIQIDAPLNRGNSGGPLFNTQGQVIGVNSAIFSPNGGNVGIGFAIPSSLASHVIAQLRDQGVVQRGFLGVQIQPVNAEIAARLGLEKAAGALVAQVVADSPAEKAGLQAGDIILAYDGKAVAKMRDLPKLVALTENKTTVELEIWRDEQRQTVHAVIAHNAAEVADDAPPPKSAKTLKFDLLGLSVRTLNRELRERYGLPEDAAGALVAAVDAGSVAAQRRLREGDLITRFDKRQINSADEMKAALKAARKAKQKSVLLLVKRDAQSRFVVIPLDS